MQNFATYEVCDWVCQICKSGTDTGYWFILSWDTNLGAVVEQVLNVSGEHIEVWCVPSATHVPGIAQSQNEMFSIRVFVTSLF
jgi:hypothetical protein